MTPQPASVAIRDRIIELRRVPASELQANPKNWRQHPAEQVAALRGVLGEIGFAGAELCRQLADGSLMLIDGHARADLMGTAPVPCLVTDLTESEADLLLATFDPLGAMAEADTAKLDSLLREVQTSDEAVAKMLSDLAKDAGCEWAKENGSGEIVEDEVPEVPAEPVSKPGDLWILGEHRLLCGDSTKAEDVARVMGGERAAIGFTSPPYNVAAKSSLPNKNKYQTTSDNLKPADYLQFLVAFTTSALSSCEFVFVNVQSVSGNKLALIEYLHEFRDSYADTIIWDKQAAEPAMAKNVLNSRFEFVHVFSSKANRSIGTKSFRGNVDNVLSMRSRQDKEFSSVHKATFPVAFAAFFVETFCNEHDVVFESFLGSGTTLIAAEQLGRRCYGLEISPAYCDVIIARWEKLTQKKAELAKGAA